MTDVTLLFATRLIRLFAYGFLAIGLVLYLAEVGLGEAQIGLLLTLTLVGDALITLRLTTLADRTGRRTILIVGALLMVMAGLIFSLSNNFLILLGAAIIGVISPSGNEIGPFLAVEQAALSQLLPDDRRTHFFAWYNLVGSFATAVGTLVGGWLAQTLQQNGVGPLHSYQVLLIGYAVGGIVLAFLFSRLSAAVEPGRDDSSPIAPLGLHRSRKTVFRLAALFALDAFGGGFVIQSIVIYWFHIKFGVDVGWLGTIFFGANILAGLSALLAATIAGRIGLINTMVFTHLPSNLLLCLVPLMPNLPLAIAVLLLRFSISQMDVPTRQAYTMAVVAANERSAASGITTIARSIGAALSPALSGLLLASPLLFNAPFFLAGGLKIIYDLLLYRGFRQQQ